MGLAVPDIRTRDPASRGLPSGPGVAGGPRGPLDPHGDGRLGPNSLLGAIATANKDHAHAYLITFGVSGTIALQSAMLDLSNTITGGSVISGNSATNGGGLYNAIGATSTVDDSILMGNSATGGPPRPVPPRQASSDRSVIARISS